MITFIVLVLSLVFFDRVQPQAGGYIPVTAHYFNTNVLCGYGTDCVINCSETITYTKGNIQPCAYAQIEASDAKSLTVICDSSNYVGASKWDSVGYSGCMGTQITCPFADRYSDTKCTVLCSNPNDESGDRPGGCENTFISSYVNRKLGSLHVTCAGTDACKGLSVYAPSYAEGITAIECNAHSDEFGDSHDACSAMSIHAAYYLSTNNWLDLHCENDQCEGLKLTCDENTIGGTKAVSQMAYNEDEGEYECDNDRCCPLVSNSGAATEVLRGVAESSTNGDRVNEGALIALVVVSVLLVIMCFVSGYLVLKLQKEKQDNAAGFVQMKD